MKRVDLLVVLLLLVALMMGCKRQNSAEGQLIEIDWLQPADSSREMYLMTYGANDMVIDTLLANKKGRMRFSRRVDRDTIDLFLLRSGSDELLIPLFPHQLDDISVKYDGDSLYMKGIKYQEQIHRYYTLLDSCQLDVSEDMLSFLQEQNREPVTLLFVRDLIRRFPQTTCVTELSRIEDMTLRISMDYARIIGAEGSLMGYQPRYEFPNYVRISGKESSIDLKKKMDKKPLMAVALMDISTADSTHLARAKKYYSTLDSLGLPSLSVLPFVDSLLKGWSVVDKGTWRYFMLDSIGDASNFIDAYHFSMPPIYMLVDSTMQIWRRWNTPDSLVNFMKSYDERSRVSNK